MTVHDDDSSLLIRRDGDDDDGRMQILFNANLTFLLYAPSYYTDHPRPDGYHQRETIDCGIRLILQFIPHKFKSFLSGLFGACTNFVGKI